MKKEYMIPQLEEIVLKSKGALLTESLTKSGEEVNDGLASEFFDDENEEEW